MRDNPVAAALIGMGALWLFVGGGNTSLFGGGGRKSIFGTAAEGAGQVGGVVWQAGRQAGNAAGAVVESASNLVRQGTDAAGEATSNAAGQTGEAVATAYHAAGDVASQAADQLSSSVQSLQNTGAEWGTTVQKNIADLFERQPLLLGAIGVAIGAGIAASIPTTDAENELMRDTSDALRETVSHKLGDVKDMADAAVAEAEAIRGVAAKVQGMVSGGGTASEAGTGFRGKKV